MFEFRNHLREEFADPDYRAGYAESFVDSWIGMQIKVIREQRNMTQKDLADALHTTQTAISRLENVNYAGRSISTLKAVAKVLDVRLKVSFETYGSLIGEADQMSVEFLHRPSFAEEISVLGNVPLAIGLKRESREEPDDLRSSGLQESARGKVLQFQQRPDTDELVREFNSGPSLQDEMHRAA